MSLNPITRKEQYYDGMINDTPVPDPVTRDEHFLKDLADKIAQGGGGAASVTLAASGDNLSGDISLADLKTALSKGVVLLSFPTDGNADERVVAEYTDDSTNGLRIGVFSEDEYIVYSVVDDGNDGVTLTVVSEKGLGEQLIHLTGATTTHVLTAFQAFVQRAVTSPNEIVGVDYTGVPTPIGSMPEVAEAIKAIQQGYSVWVEYNNSKLQVTDYADEHIGFVIALHGFTVAQNTRVWGNISVLLNDDGDTTQHIKLTGALAVNLY